MNVNTAFPSKYLKAADLGDTQPVVTISHVEIEEVGQDKEKRPVCYFQGKVKGVVLNRSNANSITAISGTPETDEWPGVQVQLYVAVVSFRGEEVEAIRMRAPKVAPKPRPAPVPPPPEMTADDIPF